MHFIQKSSDPLSVTPKYKGNLRERPSLTKSCLCGKLRERRADGGIGSHSLAASFGQGRSPSWNNCADGSIFV